MHIKPDRVAAHIVRHGLQPVYLIFGDEPQQLKESTDAVRAAAKSAGVDERTVYDVEVGFDWDQLVTAAANLSLFAARRLIEIRLGSRKPDKNGAAVLREMASAPQAEDVLLVTADKLDRNAQKSPWFKALDAAGVVVQVRQLGPKAVPAWLVARAVQHGKVLSADAAELVAAQVEGNMLAAAQEVEKLCLIIEDDRIDIDQIMSAVTDNARFDVFGLVDAALAGDGRRTLRMLRGLRAEGTEAVIIGWAVNRELRSLARMAVDVERGDSAESVIGRYRVWKSRAGATRSALKRHTSAGFVKMLRDSALIDRMIKGVELGNPWDELEQLCMRLAGIDILSPARN